jgi:hypothetical protein
MKTYTGTLQISKTGGKSYYLFDLERGEQVPITPTQQDIFNDELIGNKFLYIYEEKFAYAWVIITNQYTVLNSDNLMYQFSLKPSEIEELDTLKEAVKLLYNRTGPTSFQFSESIEYGRTVHVSFDDFNIVKEITDKSKPNIQ